MKISSKMRFCTALGAASGAGHVLFGALTRNLGPIAGLALGAVSIAALVAGIFLALELCADRAAR